MNIFVLSRDIAECAKMHCDKHVVKMITEHTQMLSTAKRTFDGVPTSIQVGSKTKKINLLPGEELEVVNGELVVHNKQAFLQCHDNHPCTLWTKLCDQNYNFLVDLTHELIKEYEYRYQKHHGTTDTFEKLIIAPKKIRQYTHVTTFAQAMPDQYKIPGDPVTAYIKYYNGEKHFATWKNREIPFWYCTGAQHDPR